MDSDKKCVIFFCPLDIQLGLGLTTKAALTRLHEAGDTPSSDVTKFFKAAK